MRDVRTIIEGLHSATLHIGSAVEVHVAELMHIIDTRMLSEHDDLPGAQLALLTDTHILRRLTEHLEVVRAKLMREAAMQKEKPNGVLRYLPRRNRE